MEAFVQEGSGECRGQREDEDGWRGVAFLTGLGHPLASFSYPEAGSWRPGQDGSGALPRGPLREPGLGPGGSSPPPPISHTHVCSVPEQAASEEGARVKKEKHTMF